ncbi:hypothetical protein NDU88_006042 [Pleurodeles waltl]|uniref:Uncharacterized protein n=1 Tax=Pleurodeles waltl TaxID=8319 RepID=A0AAV7TZ46_PLEWA|nr:hypothetical protein NDU88_006042 [Pleurodeles waltl]
MSSRASRTGDEKLEDANQALRRRAKEAAMIRPVELVESISERTERMNLELAPGEQEEVQEGLKVGSAQNPHAKSSALLPASVSASTYVEWRKPPRKRRRPTPETSIYAR